MRGIANDKLSCELAFKLGQAGAHVLTNSVHKARILIGRDTRISGDMLESALVAGICSVGAEAVVTGVIPTSGVAFLTRDYGADAGVVISASHNLAEYNGIKFFNADGNKLTDEIEERIESIILDGSEKVQLKTGTELGRRVGALNALAEYKEFLLGTTDTNLRGLKIVLDCAHGAASVVGPRAFQELGATVVPYYNTPDGTNINDNCGSTHPEKLTQLVTELGADMGLAFDGDADRVIAVDEHGVIVDGDQIMAICAIYLKERGLLKKDTLVHRDEQPGAGHRDGAARHPYGEDQGRRPLRAGGDAEKRLQLRRRAVRPHHIPRPVDHGRRDTVRHSARVGDDAQRHVALQAGQQDKHTAAGAGERARERRV